MINYVIFNPQKRSQKNARIGYDVSTRHTHSNSGKTKTQMFRFPPPDIQKKSLSLSIGFIFDKSYTIHSVHRFNTHNIFLSLSISLSTPSHPNSIHFLSPYLSLPTRYIYVLQSAISWFSYMTFVVFVWLHTHTHTIQRWNNKPSAPRFQLNASHEPQHTIQSMHVSESFLSSAIVLYIYSINGVSESTQHMVAKMCVRYKQNI